MSAMNEINDEKEILEPCAQDEKYNDFSMFSKLMKLPTAVILQRTEEMEKELVLTEESSKKTVLERKILEKRIANMTVEALKTRIRRKKAVIEVKDYCKKLEEGQALYNSLVEPFNEFEIARRENARKLSVVSNTFKENEKVFDEMRVERNQNKLKMQKVLDDKRAELDGKISKLNNLNAKLEKRKISMNLKLEKRNKLKNELKNLKVDEQIEEMNYTTTKIVETKHALNNLDLICKENDLKIEDKSQEVHETKMHLKSIKDELEDKNMAIEILEQRIKNKKTFILQCIQTTMKQECDKVYQANLNIATEMSFLMKKKDEHDILMKEIAEKSNSLVQDRENIVQQQARLLMEVEEQRRKVLSIPIINPAFELQIEELKKKIEDSKERKLKQDAIYKETQLKFEMTLNGLIKQQEELLGVASSDISLEDKTSCTSIYRSLSQSSDIQQIEKVDLNVMCNTTMNSFSPYTAAAKINKLQAKHKKNHWSKNS